METENLSEEDLMDRVKVLEAWRHETELWQQSMARWRGALDKQTEAINSMVELFNKIEGSLWLFVRLGNALKWVAGTVAAGVAILYAIRKVHFE